MYFFKSLSAHAMRDRYGREFDLAGIKNPQNILLEDWDETELTNHSDKFVFSDGYLYRFDELNRYLKKPPSPSVICPYRKINILPQLPEFQKEVQAVYLLEVAIRNYLTHLHYELYYESYGRPTNSMLYRTRLAKMLSQSGSNTLKEKIHYVGELYSTLFPNIDLLNPKNTGQADIENFVLLFNSKDTKETIAKHRDPPSIRFLNIVYSILTCGLKNIGSYALTNYYDNYGYWGFWSSRGARFNEYVDGIIQPYVSAP